MAKKIPTTAKSRTTKVAVPALTVKGARVAKVASSKKAGSKAPVAKSKVALAASNKANAAKLGAQRIASARAAADLKAQPVKTGAKSPIVAKATASSKSAPKANTAKTVQMKAAHSKVAAAKVAAAARPAAAAVAAAKPALANAHAAPVSAVATAAKAAVARPVAQPLAGRAVPASVAKPSNQKISAPVPAPKAVAASTPAVLAEKAAVARVALAANKKPVSARHGFKTNEYVVYPAHGVGRIVGIEEQEIAGMSLELFVITFDKEKLTLRVPTGKLQSIGMRKLAEDGIVKRAMETLKGRARVKRTMWSRRAQEYVAKINSGDLISIAEVVRDLYRSEAQPEQSYSERQLYENALERMARELAAVERMDERGAVQKIVEILSRSAKGRRMAAEEAEAAAAEDGDVKAA